VFSKTWDGSHFLLGFSSMPPRILLDGSSESEEAKRRNRGGNEVAKRRQRGESEEAMR